jgi:hypothetical protein
MRSPNSFQVLESSVKKGLVVYPVLNLIRKPIRSIITAYLLGGLVTFSSGQVSGYAGLGITIPTGDFASNNSSKFGKASSGALAKIGLDVLFFDNIGVAMSAMVGANSHEYQYSSWNLIKVSGPFRHYGAFGGLLVALNNPKVKIRVMPGFGNTSSPELKNGPTGRIFLPEDSAGAFGFDIGASYEHNLVDKMGLFIGFDFLHWKAEFKNLEPNFFDKEAKRSTSLFSLTGGIAF